MARTVLMRLPSVSMPSDRGVTSTSSSACVADERTPERMAPCTAAPYATASSGLMDLHSSLPPKNSDSMDCILGMRVEPPTSTTSSTSVGCTPPSRSTPLTVSRQRLKCAMLSSSNLARVSVSARSTPSKKDSTSICVVTVDDSRRLARSHAVRRRRCARLSACSALTFSSESLAFFLNSAIV